jgi:hypothetical protein
MLVTEWSRGLSLKFCMASGSVKDAVVTMDAAKRFDIPAMAKHCSRTDLSAPKNVK